MPTRRLALTRGSDRRLIADVEVADSFLGRLRGLMGRRALGDGEGLYLAGTNGVHMLFMRFPIDCIFLGPSRPDESFPIVRVSRSLRPWRGVVWYARGARAVVELPAGAADRHDLSAGDFVTLEPLPAQ